MKHNLAPIRPAMTAIAAVIALSSTPLLAQAAEPGAAPPEPIVAPAPTVAPAETLPVVTQPAVAQAAAPDPGAPAPAATPSTPTQPVMKTVGTPVEHGADTPAESQTVARAAPARHATPPAPVVASHAAKPADKPVEATPREASAVAQQPVTKPAPVAEKATPAPATPAPVIRTTRTSSTVHDETLPIAGAVSLGLLAIGGFALARRKRHDEDDELLLETPIETAPVVAAEPITMAPKVAEINPAPVAIRAATPDRLPNGFDLSRFGPHTRAAYLGPTPDNPSLSLKHRLKRASFFDQRAREAAAAATLPEPALAKTPQAERDNGQITVRLAPHRQSTRFGYVLQR